MLASKAHFTVLKHKESRKEEPSRGLTLKVLRGLRRHFPSLGRPPHHCFWYFINGYKLLESGGTFACTWFFIRAFFRPSTETFISFSEFQYQNFLRTFLAKIFESQCIAYAHYWKVESYMYACR